MQKYTVKSLWRALDIVEFIATGSPDGVSVSEVARANQTTKSNAFGILQTLVDRGYLADSGDGMTRRYRLGPMFLRMAQVTSAQQPLAQLVQATLAEATAELGLPSRYAVLERGYAVALHKQEASGPIQVAAFLGRQEMPHCSGVGKALLSMLPEERVREIVAETGLPRRTARTHVEIDSLLADLRIGRARGYLLDDEEDNEGVFCAGAAVIGVDGAAIGAISVSGLRRGLSDEALHGIGQRIATLARQLSHRLGAP